MSLTAQDLKDIRKIIFEAFEVMIEPRFEDLENQVGGLATRMGNLETNQAEANQRLTSLEAGQRESNQRLTSLEIGQRETNQRLSSIEGQLESLENDIKELYAMIDQPSPFGKKYAKLSDEDKVHVLYNSVLILAKHLRIQL